MKLRENIEKNLPFLSVINYGNKEFVGIIINQDKYVTSFYDLNVVKEDALNYLLDIGELWWWESNRKIPINIFCKEYISSYQYAIKTFNSKDVRIILGPVVNLINLNDKGSKRKNITLVGSK